MKIRLPKRIRPVGVKYATTNPNYPGAHNRRYDEKSICDRTWGERHTIKIFEVVKRK